MHIDEGILAASAGGKLELLVGWALSSAGVAVGLRKLDYERVPQVALLSAAFFVASLVHVPLGGGATAHLVLNGLIGLVLGWAAFPALFVALFLQAVLYKFGGLTALGVNTLIMALPAVVSHYVFRGFVRSSRAPIVMTGSFFAGALAILLSGTMAAAALWGAQPEYRSVAGIVLGVHLPIALVEGVVTVSAVLFLRKVCPEMLTPPAIEHVSLGVGHE